VSLLLSEGHPWARDYPIAVVWSEARIVRQRQANKAAQETVLMQMTIGSVFDAKAGKQLSAILKGLGQSE
jgi:hypothetical protein